MPGVAGPLGPLCTISHQPGSSPRDVGQRIPSAAQSGTVPISRSQTILVAEIGEGWLNGNGSCFGKESGQRPMGVAGAAAKSTLIRRGAGGHIQERTAEEASAMQTRNKIMEDIRPDDDQRDGRGTRRPREEEAETGDEIH